MSGLTKQQLKDRQKRIGGTDAAVIYGVSPWKTIVQLWDEKKNGCKPIPDNQHMKMGRMLEPVVAELFKEEHPELEVLTPVQESHFHPEHDFMVAHPDRVYRLHEGGRHGVLEIKTSRRLWDTVPEHYDLQVRHYMAVLDLDEAYIVNLAAGLDYQEFHLTRSRVMEDVMIERQDRFMKSLKGDECPYGPEDLQDVSILYPDPDPDEVMEVDEDTAGKVVAINRLGMEIKHLTDQQKALKTEIGIQMGPASKMVYEGKTIVTYGEVKGRLTFDLSAFRDEHGDEETEKYMKRGNSFRRMTIRKFG